jgi:UDP-3-O-[3-hydroxymyristoyl] glucosamine N-acyltransferase
LAGCVIGSDGYGYEFLEGAHQRVPQVGNVVLEADVDVGANTTIDRARFGSTRIGAGTKIDNQVQIAHNVRVGRHCLIVAQVGISGSTVLGDGVVVGGQAGIAGHLKIGSGAMIAGGTAVVSDIEPQAKVRGYPAMPMMLFNRMAVLQRKLPDLFKRFDQLEKTVESLPEQP